MASIVFTKQVAEKTLGKTVFRSRIYWGRSFDNGGKRERGPIDTCPRTNPKLLWNRTPTAKSSHFHGRECRRSASGRIHTRITRGQWSNFAKPRGARTQGRTVDLKCFRKGSVAIPLSSTLAPPSHRHVNFLLWKKRPSAATAQLWTNSPRNRILLLQWLTITCTLCFLAIHRREEGLSAA
ncbi:hypothetical protein BGW80DRAFT_725281 [Lactifluus volemus]|nr:hypothetical protein BGW80DRAFT_725281 [Lactifluus volemus]